MLAIILACLVGGYAVSQQGTRTIANDKKNIKVVNVECIYNGDIKFIDKDGNIFTFKGEDNYYLYSKDVNEKFIIELDESGSVINFEKK